MAMAIAKSYKNAVKQCTPELLKSAQSDQAVSDVCRLIKQDVSKLDEGLMDEKEFSQTLSERKKALPVAIFHASFKAQRRKDEDAKPSGLSLIDIDKMETDPRDFYESKVKGREAELGIVMVHVTPSTKGLRLVFRIPKEIYEEAYRGKEPVPDGSELELAQKWMAKQLNLDKFDECCKDYARCSFIVPETYNLYYDADGLFGTEEPTLWKQESKAESKEPAQEAKGQKEPGKGTSEAGSEAKTEEPTFKGIAYSKIIAEWWKLTGGEPVEGERNDRLHKLAYHLRFICDDNEDLIYRIMPDYGLGESEMKGLIKSALEAKRAYLPQTMREAIAAADKDGKGVLAENIFDDIPEMPTDLPDLVALLLGQTPDIYKPAVAHAIFPSLGAHLWQTYFLYTDNKYHECTFMNVLMAGTGAGKDCITDPINYIMADIRQRDEINLEREREWKTEIKTMGSNKDKNPRPDGLIIQEIDPDITNPAFVLRLKEAEKHFLYAKMNEIDQFNSLKGNGRGNQQFQIMCLAFDPDNRYGQTRVGAESVTEKVCVRFNWNAATTIGKGQRYFQHVLADGPVSRINFCTIPEREIGAPQPVYGLYPDDFADKLKPYIDRLVACSGKLYIKEANDLIERLREESTIKAELSQSRVYENLSFRAQVIAWLKSCLLFVAHGKEWHDNFEDFIRWSYFYDLNCKMKFFGADIEKASGVKSTAFRADNLLNNLPEVFSKADAERIRAEANKDKEGTQGMLYKWTMRGYIEKLPDGRYKKT